MKTELVSLIVKAVQELTAQQDIKITVPLDSETRLFGRDGLLDSLGLVTLVVAMEQAIQDEYGFTISLADEKALSQKSSPYRTVGALAEYAHSLIRDAA